MTDQDLVTLKSINEKWAAKWLEANKKRQDEFSLLTVKWRPILKDLEDSWKKESRDFEKLSGE